jgi:hypothetical protein
MTFDQATGERVAAPNEQAAWEGWGEAAPTDAWMARTTVERGVSVPEFERDRS